MMVTIDYKSNLGARLDGGSIAIGRPPRHRGSEMRLRARSEQSKALLAADPASLRMRQERSLQIPGVVRDRDQLPVSAWAKTRWLPRTG
jgi:hypothetical protein